MIYSQHLIFTPLRLAMHSLYYFDFLLMYWHKPYNIHIKIFFLNKTLLPQCMYFVIIYYQPTWVMYSEDRHCNVLQVTWSIKQEMVKKPSNCYRWIFNIYNYLKPGFSLNRKNSRVHVEWSDSYSMHVYS